MIAEIDIYRTAKILIDRHGDEALLEAMHRIARYRAIGKEKDMDVWRRIGDEIEFLAMPPDLSTQTLQ